MRRILGLLGAVLLVFGFFCLNYTKIGQVERHREVAQARGWPEPSQAIHYTGAATLAVGAGFVGFAVGRRPRSI